MCQLARKKLDNYFLIGHKLAIKMLFRKKLFFLAKYNWNLSVFTQSVNFEKPGTCLLTSHWPYTLYPHIISHISLPPYPHCTAMIADVVYERPLISRVERSFAFYSFLTNSNEDQYCFIIFIGNYKTKACYWTSTHFSTCSKQILKIFPWEWYF